jgi:hypothetical protein
MLVVFLFIVTAATAVALLLFGITLLVAWEDRQYAIKTGHRRPLLVRSRLMRHPGRRAQL